MSKRTFAEIQAEVAEQAIKSRSYMVPRELVREAFLAKYPKFEEETRPRLNELDAERDALSAKLQDVRKRQKTLEDSVEEVRHTLQVLESQIQDQERVAGELQTRIWAIPSKVYKLWHGPEVQGGKLFDKVKRGKKMVEILYDPEHIK